MKANELRLGNWIEIDNVHQQVLEVCGNLDCINGNINGSDIYSSLRTTKIPHPTSPLWTSTANPIQLSEEWLIRAGFEKSGDDVNIQHWRRHSGYAPFYLNSYKNEPDKYWVRYYQGAINKKIEYVHQLQNTILALTGEELTFKDL